MAFSLSQHTESSALRRNGGPFGFIVLFFIEFFGSIGLVGTRTVGAILADEMAAERIEGQNFCDVAFENGGAGHAADHAGIFTLRESHAAGGFDGAETFVPVFAHAGHDDADGSEGEFLRDGVKEHVGGRAVTVDGRAVRKNHHVSARHAADHHVAIAGANKCAAGEEQITGTRFLDIEGTAFIEAPGKHFGEAFGHVLDDENGGRKVRRKLRQDKLQSVGAASGDADSDDATGRKRRARAFLGALRIVGDNGRRESASHDAFGDFDFIDESVSDGFKTAGGGIDGLGDEVDGAESESLERGVGAFFRMSAEENDGQRSAAHDEAESFHAVHAGHLEIEGDDVGLELFDFFESESAVHGGADDLDGGVAGEDGGNEFAHQRGIIDNQDTDAFAHAIAPSGVARERRERTAGTLRIRATVPSPRIEAPLTRSLGMMSVGKALMTSSSSPTRLSTRRPKRFSAAPMTMTKFFL